MKRGAKELSERMTQLIDDMAGKDTSAEQKFGSDFEQSKLGTKLHKAFTAEIGEEVCQAEVAHHANKGPEYLCSRHEKWVHLYKQGLGISTAQKKKKNKTAAHDVGDWEEGEEPPLSVQRSDMALYEKRSQYWFPEGTPLCPYLPSEAGLLSIRHDSIRCRRWDVEDFDSIFAQGF